MKKIKKQTISKIDIDNLTNEPSIIQVPIEEVESEIVQKENVENHHHKIKKEDLEDRKSIGKQLVMKRVLGINPNEEPSSKSQKLIKTLFTVLFAIVVVGVLAWTAYNDFFSEEAIKDPPRWSEIGSTLGANWYFFLFALLSLFCCFLFKGMKLSVLCKHMTNKFHFKTCFETGIIGHYYNNITPLAVGGQPFEIYHLSKHGVHGGVASSMPIAAYFTYQMSYSILAIFSIVCFIPSLNVLQLPSEIIDSPIATALRPMAFVGLFFGIFLPCTVILFCIFPRLGAKIVGFSVSVGTKLRLIKDKKATNYKALKTVSQNSKCLKSMAKSPLTLIFSLILGMFEVFSLCSISYFVLRSFGFDFPAWSVWEWSQIVQVCIVLYSAISFIPTPGNSGAADLSFYWLFKIGLFAVAGLSFPAMLTWRILSYYSFIIIGFAFTTAKRKSDRRKERLGMPLYKE